MVTRKLTSLDDLAVRAINLDYTLTHEEAVLVWQLLPASTQRCTNTDVTLDEFKETGSWKEYEVLIVEGLGVFKITDGK